MTIRQALIFALGCMSVGAASVIIWLGFAGALSILVAFFCASLVGGGGIGLIFSPMFDEGGAS